jgi:hypothetical protein
MSNTPGDVVPPRDEGGLRWDGDKLQRMIEEALNMDDPTQRELAARVARDWAQFQVLSLAGQDVSGEMVHLNAQIKALTATARIQLVGAARSVWTDTLTTLFNAAINAAG